MKQMRSTPATTKRAMTRPSFQGYVEPPHCNASSRHTMPGRKTSVPRGSSRVICSERGAEVEGDGMWRTMAKTAAATTPIGRLKISQSLHIQKEVPVQRTGQRG